MTHRTYFIVVLLIGFVFMGAGGASHPNIAFAADSKDMGGWEKDSLYNRLYNPSEMDRIKGQVEKITEIVPLPGMAPGVAIILRQSKSETIEVHVCPSWYIDANSTGVKKGDTLKIRGSWAEVGDNFVFMASKIKKGDFFELKVRLTKDGTPFWTMSPEELERETSQ